MILYEFETMQEMISRLGDSGSSAQAKAVLAAIKLISCASGTLDTENRTTALFHRAFAIAGNEHAAKTAIEDCARTLNADNWEII